MNKNENFRRIKKKHSHIRISQFVRTNKLLKNTKIDNLWYYICTNIVRAPLEALLSLYLAEAWMIFTPFFTTQSRAVTAKETIYMIFFPLAIASAVCLVYSLGACLTVGIWAYFMQKNHLSNIENNDSNHVEKIVSYFYIDRIFGFVMGVVHVIGALCYGGISFWVAFNFSNTIFMNDLAFNHTKFILGVSIFGLALGTLWNIYGYHSDRRIDWSKIFFNFSSIKISQTDCIRLHKLKYYRNSLLYQVICCMAIIGFVIYILLDFRLSLFNNMTVLSDILSYSAFLTLLITVITLYARQMIDMFYSRKYIRSVIFPSLLELSPSNNQIFGQR